MVEDQTKPGGAHAVKGCGDVIVFGDVIVDAYDIKVLLIVVEEDVLVLQKVDRGLLEGLFAKAGACPVVVVAQDGIGRGDESVHLLDAVDDIAFVVSDVVTGEHIEIGLLVVDEVDHLSKVPRFEPTPHMDVGNLCNLVAVEFVRDGRVAKGEMIDFDGFQRVDHALTTVFE